MILAMASFTASFGICRGSNSGRRPGLRHETAGRASRDAEHPPQSRGDIDGRGVASRRVHEAHDPTGHRATNPTGDRPNRPSGAKAPVRSLELLCEPAGERHRASIGYQAMRLLAGWVFWDPRSSRVLYGILAAGASARDWRAMKFRSMLVMCSPPNGCWLSIRRTSCSTSPRWLADNRFRGGIPVAKS